MLSALDREYIMFTELPTNAITSVLVLVCLLYCVNLSSTSSMSANDDYLSTRTQLLRKDKSDFVGGKLVLSQKEVKANGVILAAKDAVLLPSYKNESLFLPLRSFLESRREIDDTYMFNVIKKLPKGASLHTHMLAAVNVDFIIQNITYRDHLYGGFVNEVFKLHFFQDGHQDDRCQWKLLSDVRKSDVNFDVWLRDQFLIREKDRANPDQVWSAFKKIFSTVYEMFSYREVFEDVVYQILYELHLDNVMYTELRGTIMPLYELDGSVYSPQEYFDIFERVVRKFNKDNPDFFGARYIHSIYRGVSEDVLQQELEQIIELKKMYPDLITGIDLVGFEEEGSTLFHYHDVLLRAQNDIDFYFHAGETNWFGHTDLNLADAILLKSKRIGHGYALPKHPELLRMARRADISVELCPISNQMLLLHQDPRSHPAVHLLATDYPVVICNDDPSIWGATGLSYDWYVVFLAMTPRKSGIEVLKTFATNSIQYSAASTTEKVVMMAVWAEKWEEFLDSVIRMGEVVS